MRTQTISPPRAGTAGRRLVPVACLVAVGALLGVSTNLAKAAADHGLQPLTLLIWSVAGATLVVAGLAAATGRVPRLGRRTGEYFVVAALVGVVAPNLLMYAAVPRVGAGFVTLTLAFPPLLTYAGALALRMERFAGPRALGVALALAGAAHLALQQLARPDAPAAWIGAALLAPAILAAGNLYRTARWPACASPDELATGVLVAASAMLLAVGVLTDVPLRVRWRDPATAGLVAAQTAVLAAQYLLFFVLQRRGGPVLLSLLGSVAAVVGVPIAVLLLGEAPPPGLAAGAGLIGGGIVLVVRGGASGAPVRAAARPAPAAAGESTTR